MLTSPGFFFKEANLFGTEINITCQGQGQYQGHIKTNVRFGGISVSRTHPADILLPFLQKITCLTFYQTMKFLDWFKLKTFADDKIIMTQILKSVFGR